MKFRWVIAGLSLLSSSAWAPAFAQNIVVEAKCAKFENLVKRHAQEYQKAVSNDKKNKLTFVTNADDAEQLAFTLVTGFNMTPHNSAYVAQGLCSMQQGKVFTHS